MARRGWARGEPPMGAAGGGTPTLQLNAHAGTVTPVARAVTPRPKRTHVGSPAPRHVVPPRGTGPARSQRRAHAAPGPAHVMHAVGHASKNATASWHVCAHRPLSPECCHAGRATSECFGCAGRLREGSRCNGSWLSSWDAHVGACTHTRAQGHGPHGMHRGAHALSPCTALPCLLSCPGALPPARSWSRAVREQHPHLQGSQQP